MRAAARNNSRAQELEQQGEAVIRFIRDPDAAPEFAVKAIDGSTVNLARPWESGDPEFLGYVVRAVPHGS
jgi:hypothetical protein